MTCCLTAPPEVTLDADSITVGDIVPISVSDPRVAVSLGRAPAPGLARRIRNHEVESRIRAAGFDSQDLQLPESILVRRKATTLDPKKVREAVTDAFARQFPGAKVELIQLEVPELGIPTGQASITGVLPERFDPKLPIFVRLDIRASGFVRSAHARAMVRIDVLQPVIQVGVPAHSEIKPEDVEWVMAPLDGSREVPKSLDTFAGMLAKHALEAGQVLKADVLYMPLYVRKGETVTVKAIAGGITIAAMMRSTASGGLGEVVKVEHLTGAGSVSARIVGQRILEVIQR